MLAVAEPFSASAQSPSKLGAPNGLGTAAGASSARVAPPGPTYRERSSRSERRVWMLQVRPLAK